MRVLLAGVDGFCGFPLAEKLLSRNHTVFGIDCFHRRNIIHKLGLESIIPIKSVTERTKALQKLGNYQFQKIDISTESDKLAELIKQFRPEAICNLAQQPSPAYSQKGIEEGRFTIRNNVNGLQNLFWLIVQNYLLEKKGTLQSFPYLRS